MGLKKIKTSLKYNRNISTTGRISKDSGEVMMLGDN